MSTRPAPKTAAYIRQLAAHHHVVYRVTRGDQLATLYSRLADNAPVTFDEVEGLLIALQRQGFLARSDMVRLQAQYLNEAKL